MTFTKRRYHPIVGTHQPGGRPLLCANCGCPLGIAGTRPAIKVGDLYIHDGGCPHPFFTDYHRRQWGLPALYAGLFRRSWWQHLSEVLKQLLLRIYGCRCRLSLIGHHQGTVRCRVCNTEGWWFR